jgi:hypothetical protein
MELLLSKARVEFEDVVRLPKSVEWIVLQFDAFAGVWGTINVIEQFAENVVNNPVSEPVIS